MWPHLMGWLRLVVVASLLAGLTACSTRPPAQPENLCQIFREKPEWHKAALKMNEKWGDADPCGDGHDVSGVLLRT